MRVVRTMDGRTDVIAEGTEQEVAGVMMQIMRGPMTSMEIAAAELANQETKAKIAKDLMSASYYEAQANAEGVATRDYALENYTTNVTKIITDVGIAQNDPDAAIAAIGILDQVTGRMIPGLSDPQLKADIKAILESDAPDKAQLAIQLLEAARGTVGGLK